MGTIPWRREWQPPLVFLLENPMDRGAWATVLSRFSRVRLCATPQPTRLPHPWDSPGKKTGVGCHPCSAATWGLVGGGRAVGPRSPLLAGREFPSLTLLQLVVHFRCLVIQPLEVSIGPLKGHFRLNAEGDRGELLSLGRGGEGKCQSSRDLGSTVFLLNIYFCT